MELFRGFDMQKQYNYVLPTSSATYTYFSEQTMSLGLWGGRRVGPVREAVQSGVEFPSPFIRGQPLRTHHQFESEMPLHGEPFSPYNMRVSMPSEEIFVGGGHHHRDILDFDTMPFQRLPPSPISKEIIRYQPEDIEKEIIALGKPTGAIMSGSKRKAPPLPLSQTVAGSSGICTNNSKKIIEEWRCAVCGISATCERGMIEHLAGKKHLVKVESLKGNNTGADIGLGVMKNSVKNKEQTSEIKSFKGSKVGACDMGIGIIKSSVKKQKSEINSISAGSKEVKMIEGGRMTRKKFKFWCKMRRTGAHDEKVMMDHKKGKKHIKNRRKVYQSQCNLIR